MTPVVRAGLTALCGILAVGPTAAGAGEAVKTYEVEATFGDVAFALESAIIDRGLVVEHVSHVGRMLQRTAADVGAQERLYTEADIFLFCSATLSRKMMSADRDNLGHCPYGVFLYETPEAGGIVLVGYRRMPEGPMKEVETLLDAIAREAAGLE